MELVPQDATSSKKEDILLMIGPWGTINMMVQWQAPVQSPLSSWVLEAERGHTGISDLSCFLFLSSKNLLWAQRQDARQGWIWVWATGVCSCTQLAIQKRSQAAGQTQDLRTCPLNEWHGLVGGFNSQINANPLQLPAVPQQSKPTPAPCWCPVGIAGCL